ncbi:MAG TPA: VWA domain-containing protein [Candidatus Polarisedimenticolia bacterium]|nr:VWA domain-containing protein [Candidatus Polarisedimenticolia bacterium]
MTTFRFASPWAAAALLLLLAGLITWLVRARRRRATLLYPLTGPLRRLSASLAVRLRSMPRVLRIAGLALLVVAFARPQTGHHEEEVLTEGIDIVLALDISGSMRTEDFKPRNRLAVAKDVVSHFVRGRRNDVIGLVVFAANAYTRCPLTLDYGVLLDLLSDVQIAPREEDGTAIGMGLATAVARLKDARGKSKVIILLTDGRNNRGQIDPISGARLAQALGIKVYTIGVGTEGEAPYPIDDPILGRRYINVLADIDEGTLQRIAAETGGQYFRATDARSLQQIFRRIDGMEKTEIRVRGYTRHTEKFAWFLDAGALLIAVEMLLSGTVLRRLP